MSRPSIFPQRSFMHAAALLDTSSFSAALNVVPDVHDIVEMENAWVPFDSPSVVCRQLGSRATLLPSSRFHGQMLAIEKSLARWVRVKKYTIL